MSRVVWTSCLLVALGAAPAWAAPQRLTLDESVALARRLQPGVRAAEADAAVAADRLASARAASRPSLEVASGYTGTASRDGNPIFIANNGAHEVRAQLVGSWPLDTGQWAAGVRQAEAEARAAGAAVQTAERDTGLAVAQAFFGVLRARAATGALELARRGAEREFDAARARFANGQVTRLDVGRQEQALLAVSADLAGAEADLVAARRRFRLLTGAADDAELVEPPLPAGSAKSAPGGSRPEVRQATEQLAARRAEAEAAELARRPQLSLNGAAGWDTQGLPQLQGFGYAAGVDLSWPLWDGDRRASQARVAQAAVRRAEASVAAAAQAAQNDWIDAQARLARAEGQYRVLHQAAALAGRNLAMARVGFSEGALGGLDLAAAQRAAVEARLAELNARYDYHLAAVQLAWAAGSPWRDPP